MINQFVESLYRLYGLNKINKDKLDALLASNKITRNEYEYIISAKEVA